MITRWVATAMYVFYNICNYIKYKCGFCLHKHDQLYFQICAYVCVWVHVCDECVMFLMWQDIIYMYIHVGVYVYFFCILPHLRQRLTALRAEQLCFLTGFRALQCTMVVLQNYVLFWTNKTCSDRCIIWTWGSSHNRTTVFTASFRRVRYRWRVLHTGGHRQSLFFHVPPTTFMHYTIYCYYNHITRV